MSSRPRPWRPCLAACIYELFGNASGSPGGTGRFTAKSGSGPGGAVLHCSPVSPPCSPGVTPRDPSPGSRFPITTQNSQGCPSPAPLPQPLLVSRAVLLGVFRASPFSLWPLASLPAPAPVPSPTRLVSARGQCLCLGTPPCQPGAASHVVQTQDVFLSRSFSSSPRCRELHPCAPTPGSVLGEVRAGAGLGPAELPRGLGAGQQDLPPLGRVALPWSPGCLSGAMWLLGLAEASAPGKQAGIWHTGGPAMLSVPLLFHHAPPLWYTLWSARPPPRLC